MLLARLYGWLKDEKGQVFVENGIWIVIITLGLIAILSNLSNVIADKFEQIIQKIQEINA